MHNFLIIKQPNETFGVEGKDKIDFQDVDKIVAMKENSDPQMAQLACV